MSTISDAIKAKLNKMNRAAQDAVLGDVIQDLQEGVAAEYFSDIIGDREFTEQNYVTDEESITESLDALDVALKDVSDVADSIVKGSHVVVADEQTAGAVVIDSELDAITGFIVQVYRSDILLADYDVSATGGNLTIATNSTDYVVTTGDVVNYIIF